MHLAYNWWIALNEDLLRSDSAYKAVVGYSTMILVGTHIMVLASILNDDGSIHVQAGRKKQMKPYTHCEIDARFDPQFSITPICTDSRFPC